MPNTQKITGWKSKWGGIILAIGGAITAASQAVPPGHVELSGWLSFAGVLISAIGTGLLGVGIAHKIEKGGTK